MEQPNLSYIQKLSQGDKEFEDQIVSVLKEELPLERESYEKAAAEMDYKDCAAHVHKLKHKISILGLEKGYQVAVDFENNLRENSFKEQSKFNTVLDSMEEFLKKLI